jgi:hypothetical protein
MLKQSDELKGPRINGLNWEMLIQFFFHRVASANYKKYLINYMIIDGKDVNDFSQIQSHVVQFYKDLFGNGGVIWGSFSLDIWEEYEKIGIEDNSFLIAPFIEKKIHVVIFSMAPDKAAGPDDFSIRFYQCF